MLEIVNKYNSIDKCVKMKFLTKKNDSFQREKKQKEKRDDDDYKELKGIFISLNGVELCVHIIV